MSINSALKRVCLSVCLYNGSLSHTPTSSSLFWSNYDGSLRICV